MLNEKPCRRCGAPHNWKAQIAGALINMETQRSAVLERDAEVARLTGELDAAEARAREAVRALVRKWRDLVPRHGRAAVACADPGEHGMRARMYRECADELEAVLAARARADATPPNPGEGCDTCVLRGLPLSARRPVCAVECPPTPAAQPGGEVRPAAKGEPWPASPVWPMPPYTATPAPDAGADEKSHPCKYHSNGWCVGHPGGGQPFRCDHHPNGPRNLCVEFVGRAAPGGEARP